MGSHRLERISATIFTTSGISARVGSPDLDFLSRAETPLATRTETPLATQITRVVEQKHDPGKG